MTNFAYLRVSTDSQDVKNQKFGVLEYSHTQNLTPLKFIEDTMSGTTPWRERSIGSLLEILEVVAQKGVSVHIAKNRMVMDCSMQSTITATILGLVSQIEREFISSRTREALQKRKLDGMVLGRPKGESDTLKLDAFHDDITGYLKNGINKRTIAKLIECSPSTLYQC